MKSSTAAAERSPDSSTSPVRRVWNGLRRRTFGVEFVLRDRWRAVATVEEVAQLLFDTANISRWWPQAAGIRLEDQGDDVGRDRTGSSRLKGFLPYELNVAFRVVEACYPTSFRLELVGDLHGCGGAEIRQVGAETTIDMDLTIHVRRPVLQVLALLSRPLLHLQHAWVMRQGERGLHRELVKVRNTSGVVPP